LYRILKQDSFHACFVLIVQEQRANEVFIDVIERLMVSIAVDVSLLPLLNI